MSGDELPSVVHLLAPAPFGGLESVVRALARGQRRAGAEVHVAAIVEPEALPHPFVRTLEDDETPVRVLNVPHRAYGHERRLVQTLLLELEPDVFHSHGYRPDVLDAPMARSLDIPTVTTVHGFTGNGLRNRVYEWMQRRSFRRFDAVLAVSEPLQRELREHGVPRDRLHLVPNGWEAPADFISRGEARRELDLPGEGPVVGWVGRLSREKAPDVLVRALAELTAPPTVAVIGEGPLLPSVQDLATELGVAEQIRWLGRRDEAGRLMPAFDVLVLPSRTEGTPMVVFEATAAGVPVAGTRVGGVPDLLGSGPNVVEPEDPPAFARAMELLLTEPKAARDALERAESRIETAYGMEPWVRRHLDLYRNLTTR